jgi:hypothetical protein
VSFSSEDYASFEPYLGYFSVFAGIGSTYSLSLALSCTDLEVVYEAGSRAGKSEGSFTSESRFRDFNCF